MLLSRKLPIAAISLTVASIVAVSSAGIMVGSQSLEKSFVQTVSAIADGRRNQVQTYLDSIRMDLKITAARPDVAEAITSFSDAWQYIGKQPTKELQDRYIHSNPNPIGKKQLMDDAEKDGYDAVHRMYHKVFRDIQENKGYYDVFLINPEGDVVYTVFKELDYATNLNTGKWAKTDLANIYRDVIKGNSSSKVYFRDFRGYGPSNNAPASFIGKAIVQNETVVGVLVYQMPIDKIATVLKNRTGLGVTGEAVLMNRQGLLLVDSPMTKEDDALKTRIKSELLGKTRGKDIATGEITGYRNMTSVAAIAPVKFLNLDWVVATLVDRQEALAGVSSMKTWILAIAAAFFAIALLISIAFARSITKPIDRIVLRMTALAKGDTDFELPQVNRDDEIGQIANSLIVFRDAAIEKKRLEQEAEQIRLTREAEKADAARQIEATIASLGDALGQLAQGKIDCRIDEPFVRQFDQLRVDFNEAIGKLSNALQSVKAGSDSISSGASEIFTSSGELAKQTESNAANLERSAAALTAIMTTVERTADGATQTKEAVVSAKSDAEQGGQIALQAIEAMGRIEKSSKEITQIVGVIDDIAFQTNLLALNAGVEAARAGEAGAGFAVVASEVRALAQRSANAAKNINELISASSNEVKEGVRLVGETGESLERIESKVAEVNEVVEAIVTDAQEQADGIRGVSQTVTQMDKATHQNAAMAEEAKWACQALTDQCSQLEKLMRQFQTGTAGPDRLRAELKKAAPHAFAAQKAPPRPTSGLRQVGVGTVGSKN